MTAEFVASQRTDHGVPHAVSRRALDVAPSTFYSTSTGRWPRCRSAAGPQTPR